MLLPDIRDAHSFAALSAKAFGETIPIIITNVIAAIFFIVNLFYPVHFTPPFLRTV
jgi:hypothetical protein